jgi:hypothetical protein
MRSIHGVGELMTQVVLRGGGFLPTTPTHQPEGDVVKAQIEPEREDIMVMDTKLRIIEILQVRAPCARGCCVVVVVVVMLFTPPPPGGGGDTVRPFTLLTTSSLFSSYYLLSAMIQMLIG